MLILQTLLIITLLFFVNTFNIITTWYLAGIFLVLLGWWLLLDDGDIFVGFLWVIDLGVGLIFFIFILHYSTFLHQKSNINKTSSEFTFLALSGFVLLAILFLVSSPSSSVNSLTVVRTWFFFISWYDYYDLFFAATVTDLNLLHEVYFLNNSFEFFLINFFLLYGILSSITFSFMIKRCFSFLNFAQIQNTNFLSKTSSTYFIRTQNYLTQQATSAGTRVWNKKKDNKV